MLYIFCDIFFGETLAEFTLWRQQSTQPAFGAPALSNRLCHDILTRVRKTHVSWWHCHLESFCASGKFLRVSMKSTIKRHAQMHRFPDGLESFRMVWKVSGWTGKFPDGLESFWIVWKVSGWSGKFEDGLESFRMVWKVSG